MADAAAAHHHPRLPRLLHPVTADDDSSRLPDDACCAEYAEMSRRSLLRGALVAGATTTFGSAVLTTAPASAAPARAVLLLLSLRGASDGLSLVVPHGDPVYYQARPRIAVPAETLLAKDGFFGLHPALAPLLPLWQAGKVAAVHASGLPVRNRSHFSAMEQLEDANPGSTRREGWLNRLIGADAIASPVQALSLAEGVPPAALYGPQPYLTAGSVEDVHVSGDDPDDPKRPRRTSLRTLWANDKTALGVVDALDLRGRRRDLAAARDARRTRRTARSTPAATWAGRWPRPRASCAATSASR